MEIKEDKLNVFIEIRDHIIEIYDKVGVTLLKKH